MKIQTVPALGVSIVAVLMARAWMGVAPGLAIRWASDAPRAGIARRVPLDAFAHAVGAAGRVCRASCLDRRRARTLLLTAHRVSARLVIGVDRSLGVFTAHAWVESGGQTILGGADASKYASLPIADR